MLLRIQGLLAENLHDSSAQKKARRSASCEFAFVVAEKLRGGWVARGE